MCIFRYGSPFTYRHQKQSIRCLSGELLADSNLTYIRLKWWFSSYFNLRIIAVFNYLQFILWKCVFFCLLSDVVCHSYTDHHKRSANTFDSRTVDGFPFDVYTAGMTNLELFTKRAVFHLTKTVTCLVLRYVSSHLIF